MTCHGPSQDQLPTRRSMWTDNSFPDLKECTRRQPSTTGMRAGKKSSQKHNSVRKPAAYFVEEILRRSMRRSRVLPGLGRGAWSGCDELAPPEAEGTLRSTPPSGGMSAKGERSGATRLYSALIVALRPEASGAAAPASAGHSADISTPPPHWRVLKHAAAAPACAALCHAIASGRVYAVQVRTTLQLLHALCLLPAHAWSPSVDTPLPAARTHITAPRNLEKTACTWLGPGDTGLLGAEFSF